MPKHPETTQDNTVILTWTTHRLREDPRRMVLVVPCMVLVGWAGVAVLGSPVAGLLAMVVLAAFIGDYLFPVRYTLTPQKAHVQCLLNRQEIPWSRVKKVWLAEDGIKLSPLSRRSRLEAYRGVFLRFRDNRETVIEIVKELKEAVQHNEPTATEAPPPARLIEGGSSQ